MEKLVTFNEWLEQRDNALYAEIDAKDIWQATKSGARMAKSAWDTTGKAIGKKARNIAAGTALGAGALAYGLSGDPGIDLVAKHNNMPPAQVQQLKQDDPEYYQTLLQAAQLEKKVHGIDQEFDKAMGVQKAKPKDGYNWRAPSTHYQSPFYDKETPTPPKSPSTKDTIDRINQILGDK